MIYLTPEDLRTGAPAEIIEAMTRGDNQILDILTSRAIEQAQSYLSARYNTTAIFSLDKPIRHPLLVGFLVDMVIYHLTAMHNPQKMTTTTADRYTRAIDWFTGVQRQEINPVGLPPRSETSYVLFNCNDKKQNHF